MSQGHNYVKRLQSLATPVLLIHGGRDRIVSARSARAAADRRPEWTFHLMEEVGHVPQLEEPEATAQIILDWLAENPDVGQEAALGAVAASG
jgi:pimeloyl-ACP methyl ester carboxylesterase